MNKKLLLSFAVFAAAFGANAQKRGQLKQLPHRVTSSNYEYFQENEGALHKSTNSDKVDFTRKRGTLTITDTSTYFSSKRSYASPKTSNIQVNAYPSQAGDSTELSTVYQIIPNNSNIKLNGIKMSMVSLNKKAGSAKADVKIYDMNTGATLAKASKTIAYSATALGSYDFIFDKPLVTSSDILVSIEPQTENDTLLIPTSGGYRDASIACNITGDKLTLVTPAPGTNLGAGFWSGQTVTAAGLPAGTKVIGFDNTTGTYTLSQAASSALTNVVVTGVNLKFSDVQYGAGYMYLKFPTVAGSKTAPDFTKDPKQSPDALIWLNTGTSQAPSWKPFDANITMFPIVEYTFESSPEADNNCLGTSNTINITYKNQNAFNIVKNPLLNKMAFWTKYLGYSKKNGYFYSRALSSNDVKLKDTLDNNSSAYSFKFVETALDKNDTITVYDFILPYGYFVSPGTKGFVNKFYISSVLAANTTITPVDPKCSYDDAKKLLSLGGFAPYTGVPTVGQAAGNYTITDANKCSITITTTAAIKANPAAIVPVATVTDAKCFGEKAKVEITATGGTGNLTIPAKEEVAAVAGEKSYEVVDANACKATVKATIKAAPTAIVLDSASVMASNDKKNDGKAIVIAKGGTAPYSYTWATNNETNDTIIVGKGSYKVYVKDANNCATFATVTVGAGTASVEALAISNLSIYPNPVASELNVSFDAKSAATVELVNVAGQVIASKVANEFVTSFNTASLESGVYFVNIKVAEGIYTQKIVKD